MSEERTAGNPATPAVQNPMESPCDAATSLAPDRQTLMILGAFALLAAIIVLKLWGNYQLNAHERSGDGYYSAEQFAEAIPYLEYCVAHNAGDYNRLRTLGWSYLQTNQPDKALSCFEKLKKSPDAGKVEDLLGLSYLELGKLDEAQPLLTQALKDNPESPEVNLGMGRLLLERKQPLDAAHYFQAAAKHSEWDPEVERRSKLDLKADAYRRILAQMVLGGDETTSGPAVIKSGAAAKPGAPAPARGH